MSDRKQITISSIVALLEEGKTRREIGEHFGLSQSDVKRIFQHEKLKGRKPHKVPTFELVDDTEGIDDVAPAMEETTEDAQYAGDVAEPAEQEA